MTKKKQIPGGIPDLPQLDPQDKSDPRNHPALTATPQPRKDMHLHGLDEIPKGMKRYRHKGRPGRVSDVRMVLVQTDRGWATSGPRLVHDEEWALAEGQMGAIVAYGKTIKIAHSSRFDHVPFPQQRMAQP